MARGRRSSRPTSSLPVILVVVGCASFALGLLSPPPEPFAAVSLAHPVKTQIRALADGLDVGAESGRDAWVGLNDPSIDQAALMVDRLATPAQSASLGAARPAALQSKAGLIRFARNDGTKGY